mgnify:CR=1 FL=1
MTNTEPLTPTSVGLPPELRRRLDVAAQTLRRKRAEVIRFAITEYLDRLDTADPEGGSDATKATRRTRRR